MDDEWSLTNWSMEEKGKEIIVFFELFCISIILVTGTILKVLDWIEKE